MDTKENMENNDKSFWKKFKHPPPASPATAALGKANNLICFIIAFIYLTVSNYFFCMLIMLFSSVFMLIAR